ncbi:MAG: ATP-grasp domain-containing protein [Pseudolabrys sp.]
MTNDVLPKGKRVLLLVPAVTYRATDFVLAARRLELDLVIGSDGALPLGGQPVVHVDAGDPSTSSQHVLARVGALDAVVAVDSQMLGLAAEIAATMGLPHNPVGAVAAAADKAAQRCLWARSGVSQPAFRIVSADTEEPDAARQAKELGFPCVVKAASLSGSRAVLRANTESEVTAAVIEIQRILAETEKASSDHIVIEEYVPGAELSIDGLLSDRRLTVTAIFDKPDTPEGPTFEETLLVTPSELAQPVLTSATEIVEQAASALGLRYGPIHAELRIDTRSGEARLRMLELAARSIGGLCSRALHFLDGASLEMMVLLHSLGCRVQAPRLTGAAGVLMLPVEKAGRLEGIEGGEEALAVAGITGLSITIPLGDVVRPLPWGDRYLGFIFAEGDNVSGVRDALRAAHRKIRAVIN